MITLTDAQAQTICDQLLANAGALVIDPANPGLLAPVLGPVLAVVAPIVSAFTGGRISASDWLSQWSFTAGPLIFMSGSIKGVERVLTTAHECGHVEQAWRAGLWGSAADKFFQPMAVSYITDKPSRAWLEGDAVAREVEAMLACLGATRAEVAAHLTRTREETWPLYGLDAAQCADAAAVVESHAVSLLAGAKPAHASTRIIREAMHAMGIVT